LEKEIYTRVNATTILSQLGQLLGQSDNILSSEETHHLDSFLQSPQLIAFLSNSLFREELFQNATAVLVSHVNSNLKTLISHVVDSLLDPNYEMGTFYY
jgi:ABC-type antimicrobial peptide transport system permease subunit